MNKPTTTTATTTSSEEVLAMLRSRGVVPANARVEVTQTDVPRILGWIEWWDLQAGVRPGLLIQGIRDGSPAPSINSQAALSEQRFYDEIAWLKDKFPELCRADPKVLELTEDAFGHDERARLERDSFPNLGAWRKAWALHGQGHKLTVKAHGSEIRAAAKAENAHAIAELREIIAARKAATVSA